MPAPKSKRLLSDTHAFPGFRPAPTVHGRFGDPKTRVITLKQRSNGQPAAAVGGSIRAGTIANADACAIYSSDLQRARHTAEPIAHALGLEIVLDAGLREYDLGSWEGKTYRELQEHHQLWDHMRDDPHYAPHGGESPLEVAERFTDSLRRIAAAHAGERVVVVGHGGALSLAFAALLAGDYTAWGRVMNNCGVSELRLDPTPRVSRFNQTLHLEGL